MGDSPVVSQSPLLHITTGGGKRIETQGSTVPSPSPHPGGISITQPRGSSGELGWEAARGNGLSHSREALPGLSCTARVIKSVKKRDCGLM